MITMGNTVRLSMLPRAGMSVGLIELIRPDRGNAIDFEFAADLHAAVAGIGPDVGCVAVLADGKNFCVGGNLADFAASPDPGALVGALAVELHRALSALAALTTPVVLGAQGWSVGAGLSLVLAADIAVVESSSRLRTAYGSVGLTPDGGMSWALPRAVGRTMALDLLLTGRTLDSGEALSAGAVSRVVAHGTVRDEIVAIANAIADGPVDAARVTKNLVDAGSARTLDSQLAAEAEAIGRAAGGPEGREGISSFTDRRSPVFTSLQYPTESSHQ